MKITEVRVFAVHQFVYVKILTDAGIYGVGEASLSGRSLAVVETLEHLKPLLVGQDATRIEHIWQDDPEMQIAICPAYSDYSWEEAFERLGRLDQLMILKKPFDPAEARQIATSLTHKWSLADYLNRMVREAEHRS